MMLPGFRTEPVTSAADTQVLGADVVMGPQKVLRIEQDNDASGHEIETRMAADELGSSGFLISTTDGHARATSYGALPCLWLSMPLEEADIRRVISGQEDHARLEPYQVTIVGPDVPAEISMEGATDVVHVFLADDLLREVAAKLYNIDLETKDITPVLGIHDPSLSMLMRAAHMMALNTEEGTQAKTDYLARALAADVIGKYIEEKPEGYSKPSAVALSASQYRRTMDYIDANLSEDVTLNDLASIAGISRTSFIRRFNASMHVSPGRFLLQKRIERAQDLLATSEMSISDIAMACGFSSPSHLSVAFRRATGITPSVFRRHQR